MSKKNSIKHSETKKEILWVYLGLTLFITVCFTMINNSIDYNSGVPDYGNSSLTTSAFIGKFLGALVLPAILSLICSFLTKRYKFEQLLFFIALFIYVLSIIGKVVS
tara:strand:- start:2360 stop:2680 length:321 start_codon:yes stop_codon:yes gene_type:complete